MDEEAVLAFVQRSIKSAWSLEVLLLLYREPGRSWSIDALARELRGNPSLVQDSLAILATAGLVGYQQGGAIYQPQSEHLAALAADLAALYGQKPVAVMRAIFTSPNEKIRSFADAFLFQKKPPS